MIDTEDTGVVFNRSKSFWDLRVDSNSNKGSNRRAENTTLSFISLPFTNFGGGLFLLFVSMHYSCLNVSFFYECVHAFSFQVNCIHFTFLLGLSCIV